MAAHNSQSAMPAFRAALANQAVLTVRMPLSASDTARGWHPELARASPARLAGGRGTIRDDQGRSGRRDGRLHDLVRRARRLALVDRVDHVHAFHDLAPHRVLLV